MTKLILSAQYIPVVGKGQARWNNLHVYDLSNLFLLLAEAAVAQRQDNELWGSRGYFIVESGEHLWTDIAERIAHHAEQKGFASNLQKAELSKDAAFEQAGFQAVSWGLNSRAKAVRAGRTLGWKPTAPSLEDTLPEIVQQEHDRLQSSG